MSKQQTPTRPDWTTVELVVGSRQDYTHHDYRRLCRDCGHAVFTEHPYPHDIPILCERCFAALPAAEAIGSLPVEPDQLTDAQLLWLCQQHALRVRTPLMAVQAEAKRRGVQLRVVLRERLLAQLKEAGIV